MWSKLQQADDAELWRVKNAARNELVEFARRRARKDLARRNAPSERVAAVSVLHPDYLTIGFIGRFVSYKRPTLLLRHPERLARLLKDKDRPVQIVFAGKAHPNDQSGKKLLADMIEFAATYDVVDRVVFIVDFDTTMDRHMAQGADVWLNTPRRPLEACGVGGMKAGMNGALNFSTIDGWWDEALTDADPDAPPIGFTIGTDEPYEDEALQDDHDAASLYDVLEHEIIARFYDRGPDGLPHRWLASVKQAMSTLAPTWDSLRMTRDYTENYYLPGLAKVQQLRAGGAKAARDRAAGQARLRREWSSLHMSVVSDEAKKNRRAIAVVVELGQLEPADVRVQLYAQVQGLPVVSDAILVDRQGARARYEGRLAVAADVEVVARMIPSALHTDNEALPGLIAWSS
jgi:starch phosphorylase